MATTSVEVDEALLDLAKRVFQERDSVRAVRLALIYGIALGKPLPSQENDAKVVDDAPLLAERPRRESKAAFEKAKRWVEGR